MSPRRQRVLRFLRRLSLAVAVLLVAAGLAAWLVLSASLPTVQGKQTLVGLSAAVSVDRDANGVPTLHAANREDAARALGFLHAQDRFFQMDLLRRQAAGELAELFGPAAVPMDREMRRHRFRHRTAATLAQIRAGDLRLLDAYAAGVNTGLASLGARPWEYWLLRARPRPWTREDSLFVVETMTTALQEHDGTDERTRLAIRETYGPQVLAFLRPTVAPDSAALDGSSAPVLTVPAAEDFRALADAAPNPPVSPSLSPPTTAWFLPQAHPGEALGSNSFAVAGRRVVGGAALVGNDMHLNLAVPNTWYRASLALPGRTVTGVTLPGIPGMVAGSNGDVAWGFTDAYADTSDVVVVERDPADPGCYRVPDGDGWERFEVARETIQVAGHAPQVVEISSTRWGPLLTPLDDLKRPTLALRWVAHEAAAINLRLADMQDARNVEEAITIAHESGVPAQNIVIGDRTGAIAWTIIGRVPKRVGFDGGLPESWADGSRRWDGFLPPEDIPTIRNPPDGQIWTANNRVVGGDALARLGNGGYDLPARAAQIRDDLASAEGRILTPKDGLAVQLDDEARLLARWRGLLLTTLTDDFVQAEPGPKLGEMRDLVRHWSGHASVGDAGYPLVRDFRQNVIAAIMNPIYEPVRRHAPELELSRTRFKGAENAAWAILAARPAYLLPAKNQNADGWSGLLARAARKAAADPPTSKLADYTWGSANTLRMRHPLARLLPPRWTTCLDMPALPLPGDSNMPRVQGASFGASERMDVSPGHEAEGIFHQPGGASGHPLSPFYRAGHEDWAEGRATPFLPGPAKYTLMLQP